MRRMPNSTEQQDEKKPTDKSSKIAMVHIYGQPG
jgi:hypothetical protein